MEFITSTLQWAYANLHLILVAIATVLTGLGVVIEGIMLVIPTEDKKSALEKILKKLQGIGAFITKITEKLPSNVKKK